MDAHGIQRENVMLTPEMARKLNEEEHTQVLTYEYDTPEKLLSMHDVSQVLDTVRTDYTDLRRAHPKLTDEELRARLVAARPDAAVFSRTHPTIFVKVTDRAAPPVLLERLRQMMHIRAQQERGQLNEQETAQAVETVLKNPLK